MFYYQKITTKTFFKLKNVILVNLNKVQSIEIHRMLCQLSEKLEVSRYLIVKAVLGKIERISIWASHPNKYVDENSLKHGFSLDIYSESNQLYSIYKQLINCFEDGQDRLQEQESSGTESREGCCIYGRGNRPQLATGRHCNEAQAQGTNDCSQRNQVVVSTRCAEILGSKI